MAVTSTDCLYTTVKNISGKTMIFGFLPPHGKELTDDQEVTVLGDIVEAVVRGNRATSKRNHDALLNALSGTDVGGSPLLQIKKSPSPYFYNEDDSTSYILKVEDNAGNPTVGTDPTCTDTAV